jgi:hypothetical protein
LVAGNIEKESHSFGCFVWLIIELIKRKRAASSTARAAPAEITIIPAKVATATQLLATIASEKKKILIQFLKTKIL